MGAIWNKRKSIRSSSWCATMGAYHLTEKSSWGCQKHNGNGKRFTPQFLVRISKKWPYQLLPSMGNFRNFLSSGKHPVSSWNSSSLSTLQIKSKSREQGTRFALWLKSIIMFGLFAKHVQKFHCLTQTHLWPHHVSCLWDDKDDDQLSGSSQNIFKWLGWSLQS